MIRLYMMLGLAVVITSGVAYHFWLVNGLETQVIALEAMTKSQNKIIERQEAVNEENLRELDTIRNHQQEQTEEISSLTLENNRLVEQRNRYLRIFADHNLTRLARAKPELIETRLNNGTKAVFRSIEEDSKLDISSQGGRKPLGREDD